MNTYDPNRKVGPAGPRDAKIALIGEAPGLEEIQEGVPFVGASGRLLGKLLAGISLQRMNCYITNVIKEKPPNTKKKVNDISVFLDLSKKAGPIESPEYLAYKEILRGELQTIDANILIAFGNVPLYTLTGIYPPMIVKRRGSIYPCTLVPGKKVIACIHPAACLHGSDSKGNFLWQHLIMMDMARAAQQAETSEIPNDGWRYLISPTYDESLYYLQQIHEHDHMTAFDIEVVNLEISCISFAREDKTAISIPFHQQSTSYFTPEQEMDIWLWINKILSNKNITKLGQNLAFDIQFIFRKFGIVTNNIEDTMVAQGTLFPDFKKGLDFIASIHTDEPYYKDEGKTYMKVGGRDEDFWLYNAKDSKICQIAFPKQVEQLKKLGNLDTYNRQRNIVEPLVFMAEHGIRIDADGLKKESIIIGDRVNELTERLQRMCGSDINPDSPAQLMEYFYDIKGYKEYVNRKTGKRTTDENALKRLSRKGAPEASILLEIRRLSKLKSTYLDVSLEADNRLRCSFNPVGTENGRVSSSKTIWNTGMNMQNDPPEFKQYMMADEGYVAYEMDLSQAENRIVAYMGPEPAMIEAFASGKDVHSMTGALISGLSVEEVRQQHKENIPCSIGQGKFTWRFWGKKANHGLNYDLGYKSFAFVNEIPENDARYIVSRYHQVYPGVRQYHQVVKAQLSKNKTLINLLGRRRLFLDRWGDSLFKEAYAFPPQSTVADIINEQGLSHVYFNRDIYKPVELMNQIHDSIVFQIPISIGWTEHARILQSIKESLEQPLEYRLIKFVIPVDLKMGTRLAEKDIERSPLGNMKGVAWNNLESNLRTTWEEINKHNLS